jgi:hypothetical protein
VRLTKHDPDNPSMKKTTAPHAPEPAGDDLREKIAKHLAEESVRGTDAERDFSWEEVTDQSFRRSFERRADAILALLPDRGREAELAAKLAEAERELAEIKSASAAWMEETGQAYAYVGIRDYAEACKRANAAEARVKELETALSLVKEHDSLMARLEPDAHDAVIAALSQTGQRQEQGGGS